MIGRCFAAAALLLSLSCNAFSFDLSTAEKAVNSAFSAVPSSYEYKEESGALFFTQHKNYRFDIVPCSNGYEQMVTYSSTQNKQPLAEDPRPPVREGDCSPFSMCCLMSIANPFADGSGITAGSERAEVIRGKRYRAVPLEYRFTDENGRSWPVRGELLLSRGSGIPVYFSAEQNEFPDSIYSVAIEVEFEGSYSSTCRIAEFRRYETGQYGIFRYRYNTEYSFIY